MSAKRTNKGIADTMARQAPGVDLKPLLDAAGVWCDSGGGSTHARWRELWRNLAWELNDLEGEATRPDRSAIAAERMEAGKAFAKALCDTLAEHPVDIAGALYMGLGLNDGKGKGQIFTPCAIVDNMIESCLEEALRGEKSPNGGKPVHLQNWLDPCVGAGAFPLGILRACRKRGIRQPWIVCNDLDPVCADMAFVQITYAGGLCEVHTGDFLSGIDLVHGLTTPLTHITTVARMKLLLDTARTGR